MDEQKKAAEAAAQIQAGLTEKALADVGDDLCKAYHKIKKPLEFLLTLIEKIPGWGKAAAEAIRLLMKLADKVCPA